MLNKNYFNYLIKSKKYFLVAICIVQSIVAFSNFGKDFNEYSLLSNTMAFSYGIGMMIAFILPLVIFSYVHNKKAVDTFYSLNVSRKSMLFTGLVFCLLACFIPYLLANIINIVSYLTMGLLVKRIGSILLMLLVALISYAMLIVFNTFIYLLANTVLDGTIMIIAYDLFPIALYLMAIFFQSTFLVGVDISLALENILVYFSPVALTVLSAFYAMIINTNEYIGYLLASLVYIVLFGILLFKSFNTRKVERAGNYSDAFFAYPFVIGAYTIIFLFVIACLSKDMLGDFSFIILYILLFLAYLIGNFVYKRTFILSKLQIILFCIGVTLSLLFNVVCDRTHGFGLSYNYQFEYGNMSYTYYSQTLFKDEETIGFYDFLSEVKGIEDTTLPNSEYGNYFTLKTGNGSRTVTDLMEAYRKKAIDDYYNHNDEIMSNTLDVSYIDGDKINLSTYACDLINMDDVKTILMEDDDAYILIDDWDSGERYYIIYEDGEYVALTSDYYDLYENFGYEATKSIGNGN